MIIEFDQKKSTITYCGGKFVCLFIHHGLINKSLEISVFEANEDFQPLNPKKPLYTERVPFDERKILSAIKIIVGLDYGEATWIPDKYLYKNRNLKDFINLEEKSAQMAYGKALMLLNKKKYEEAILNITASLLSDYFKKHPKYESRFLRKQAEAYIGLNNYFEAKKALLRAMEKYEEDSDFNDYFTLGCIEYKLGNRKETVDNLKRFIKLADKIIKDNQDENAYEEAKKMIEVSNQLLEKV